MIRFPRAMLLPLVLLATAGAAPPGDPALGDAAAAVRKLGPLGMLWGRIALEEESPEGAWTPLAGVEVVVAPYVAEVAAELERIRRGARDALSHYEGAVGRMAEVLQRHRRAVDAVRRDAAEPSDHGEGLVRRRLTDPRGTFAFDDLPSGEWLLVAFRLTAYTPDKAPAPPPRASSRRKDQAFLPRTTPAVKAAEVWVAHVRVGAGERVRLVLSDRARFLAGPVIGDIVR